MANPVWFDRLYVLGWRFLQRLLRFPVPLACAVAWTAITTTGLDVFGFDDRRERNLYQGFLVLGFFLTLSAKLFAESRMWSIVRWLPLSAGALGLLALAIFLWPYPTNVNPYVKPVFLTPKFESPVFVFLAPGILLLTTISPFLRRGVESKWVWDFNFRMWTSATLSLGAVLLFKIVVLDTVVTAIWDDLAARQFSRYCGMIAIGLVWPSLALLGIPAGVDTSKRDRVPPVVVLTIAWLLVPAALVALIGLFGFGAKIAAEWQLPRNQIAWPAIAVAAYGLAVWHAAYPLRDTGNRLVRLYIRYFHASLLVPAALLAFAVDARVGQYGLTENRYGLALLTIWLAGIAAHGMLVQRPHISVTPASLAVLLLLAPFGPWGAPAAAARSQIARLDNMLTEAGAMRDGKLVKRTEAIHIGMMDDISETVIYIDRIGKRQMLLDHLGKIGVELNPRSGSAHIVAALGIEFRPPRSPFDIVFRYGSMRPTRWTRAGPVDVDMRGFDSGFRTIFGFGADYREVNAELDGEERLVRLRLSYTHLIVSTDDRGPVVIDLAEVIETLRTDGSPGANAVNNPLLTAERRKNGLNVRVYISTIGVAGLGGIMDITDIECNILIGAYGVR